MDTIQPWGLENVLSLIIGHYLTEEYKNETMDFFYHLYKQNPRKKKSLAECVNHIYEHFPQFRSKEFEEDLYVFYSLHSQTESKKLRDSFTTYWFLQQISKYGEVLQVPCLPRTSQA